MTRPIFPEVWDNTMRSDFVSCPKSWQYSHLKFLKPKGANIHLDAGAALANAMEAGRLVMDARNYDPAAVNDAALAAAMAIGETFAKSRDPEGTAKSYDRLVVAATTYFKHYGVDYLRPLKLPTGKPAVEFSFTAPIDVRHPVTGNPIIFSGRFDALCQNIRDDSLWGVDEKSTSGIGPSWARQWPLRAQFTGYSWGARQFGYQLKGFVVRGIAVLKTEIKHVEAIINIPQWQIDRWYEQLCRDVQRAIDMWDKGYFDWNLSDSCSAYGGCDYMDMCVSPQPENWESAYDRFRWDPIQRKQIPILVDSMGDDSALMAAD